MSQPVWYVSYGSNLSAGRFGCYVRGGTPTGGVREYPGCRDRTPASENRAVFITGRIYFAGRSLTWGGGMAFLDPGLPGEVPARAWRITTEQLADVCAQEMRRTPGSSHIPLSTVVEHGEHRMGDGHYETLIHLGDLAGIPMVTFTAPHRLRPETAPSAPYLDMITEGLSETHGWSGERARKYLTAAAGSVA